MDGQQKKRPDPVADAFKNTRSAWLHISIFSALINILMLTGSLYMMQVYDRVLASRSVPTLAGISLLALAAFALQGWLDHVRMGMLGRIGANVDAALAPFTLRAAMSAPMKGIDQIDAMQPFRDLQALRGFLSSLGPTALIDMPFAPLFLVIAFMLHSWIGWLSLGGMIVIVALTLLTERYNSGPGRRVAQSGAEQSAMIETGRRNAELVHALGMHEAFANRFRKLHLNHVDDTLRMSEATGGVSAFAKSFRFILQSSVLGLGAFLVIKGEMSGGAMLAASILTSRALAPVELAVAHLRGMTAARQGYARLKQSLPHFSEMKRALALPAPRQNLLVEDLNVIPPGGRQATVTGVSFELRAGEALGLIGPSGSGKSSLARAVVGIWGPARGVVRLDGAFISQWDPVKLGRSIGYLPQDVELFPGTIAENIARFAPDATPEQILAAAKAAGTHAMVVGFPEGYETRVGEGGRMLSGGQRQRIALARALYGDPFLVVLDEPNSSLDSEGDAALSGAIASIRARGGIVVVITHRPSGLAAVDLAGVMANGRLTTFGPRDQVLLHLAERAPPPQAGVDAAPETADPPLPAGRDASTTFEPPQPAVGSSPRPTDRVAYRDATSPASVNQPLVQAARSLLQQANHPAQESPGLMLKRALLLLRDANTSPEQPAKKQENA